MPDRKNKKPGLGAKILWQVRRIFGLNIGTMIFGVLFLYMIFTAVVYLTSSHIEAYQVTVSPLSRNETYTGLAIHDEIVCQAPNSGYVNYYARECGKVNAGGVVYGLSQTQIPVGEVTLSEEQMAKVKSDMLSFARNFSSSRFNTAYSFKYQLEGSVLQYAGVIDEMLPAGNTSTGAANASTATAALLGNQTLCKAPADGIVLYSKDGYAGKTLETLNLSDFNQNSYHETDLKTNKSVHAGQDIYTLITDEDWSLLIPLSDKQIVRLKDRTAIRVKFLKDDMTQVGDFSVIQIQGANYGKLDFSRGLVRYAQDRFLDIELVTNTSTGLKIPLSAIVTKEFYTIPASFATQDDEYGFFLEQRAIDGSYEKKSVYPTIYASISDNMTTYLSTDATRSANTRLYVDKSVFRKGDVLVKEDGEERFVIGDTDVLEGVYSMNQGYAVFRRIIVLDQNEEFAIVEKDTDYGLVRYDHIVWDAKDVSEKDILY